MSCVFLPTTESSHLCIFYLRLGHKHASRRAQVHLRFQRDHSHELQSKLAVHKVESMPGVVTMTILSKTNGANPYPAKGANRPSLVKQTWYTYSRWIVLEQNYQVPAYTARHPSSSATPLIHHKNWR